MKITIEISDDHLSELFPFLTRQSAGHIKIAKKCLADAVRAVINEVEVYMIKKTDSEGVSFPSDLKNLSYEEAVEQLNLLEQQTGFSNCTPDRQGEDVLCRNYTDGSFELFEIEEEI